MIYLLDVNVLIALIDSTHGNHDAAHRWFEREIDEGWASCPITQNGTLRIVGHPSYVNSPGSPARVAQLLSRLAQDPRHQFWPDDISLLTSEWIETDRIIVSRQVADTCLLALASVRGAQLATFDRRLVTDAVKGGQRALHLIQP